MNDELELELRKALGRSAAPGDFVDKVMRNLPAETSAPAWWRAAIAAGLIGAVTAGGIRIEHHKREEQAQSTEQRLVYAFSFAAEKLQRVNGQLQRSAPELKLDKKRGKQYEE